MKVLILAPYPLGKAPSQRFRFEHFLKFMEEKGITYDFQTFVSEVGWEYLYVEGNTFNKIGATLSGFLRRFSILFKLSAYTSILIHRELTPFGPPIFEWVIAKVLRKKIIYDFDDAIWMADGTNESKLWKWLKWRSKVASICRWSWKVSVGNAYLAKFAAQYCDQVEILPTVVDTEIHNAQPPRTKSDLKNQQPTANSQQPIIGWTGSHSTLQYLRPIVPVLQQLENTHDFTFLVIANQDPQLPLKNYRFAKWNKESEVEDLAQIDIGVMPLEDNEWSKGKCGFKLIQYLSLGIPAVASPVGVNAEIVIHNETGLIATTSHQWLEALKQLLESEGLRKKMGDSGRKLIETKYSVESQQERFLQLFQ
ncbi:MAG: glycosyltransferase [Cyclobacteriaceae bacterium]